MDEKITRLEDEIHIRKIIDHLRPYIMGDGGDIEFVEFKDGIVTVRLLGACVGCSLIDVTLNNGIKNWIMEEVPNVKDVVLVQDTFNNTDPFDIAEE
jgi:Fe-S cluster biogenesis protein NfuA